MTRSLRVEVDHISKNHEQFATKELEHEVRTLNEKLDWVIDEMKQNWL